MIFEKFNEKIETLMTETPKYKRKLFGYLAFSFNQDSLYYIPRGDALEIIVNYAAT